MQTSFTVIKPPSRLAQFIKRQLRKKKVWIPTLVIVFASGLIATEHEILFSEYHLLSWSDDTSEAHNTDGGGRASSESPSGDSGYDSTPTPTPEPGTLLMLGSGLAGLAAWRKKFSN